MGTEPATAERHYARDTLEFARAFTFFDAVYAFALTLLVVNLDPPTAADWTSLSALLASGLEWQLLGFAISFAVIAVFWRVNHRIVAGFRALSPGTITANLVAIAFVVLIPFSTQGVSDIDTADAPLAVAVYAVNISCAVLAQTAMFYVARHDGVLAHPLPRRADTGEPHRHADDPGDLPHLDPDRLRLGRRRGTMDVGAAHRGRADQRTPGVAPGGAHRGRGCRGPRHPLGTDA